MKWKENNIFMGAWIIGEMGRGDVMILRRFQGPPV